MSTQIEFWAKVEQIEGLSVVTGLDRACEQKTVYKKTLKLMIQESVKSINNLTRFLAKGEMKEFRIEVHAIKSALANIGAMELYEKALLLETGASRFDYHFCDKNLPAFLEGIHDLVSQLTDAFSLFSHFDGMMTAPQELPRILRRLNDAIGIMDLVSIEKEIENLDFLPLSGPLHDDIEYIKDLVLMMDYDEAAKQIRILLRLLNSSPLSS